MSGVPPLLPEDLRRRCDPACLAFETSAELADLDETTILGQKRAVAAIEFGVGMPGHDYNVFALGPAGVGRHSVVRTMLDRRAAAERVPDDWVYVHNFVRPHNPRALRLPPGRGPELRHEMEQLVEELRAAVAAVLESEEFRNRKEAIEAEVKRPREEAFEQLERDARARNVSLVRTPVGLILTPRHEGKELGREDFEKLDPEVQKRIGAELAALEEKLHAIGHRVPQWEREGRARVRALIRETTAFAAGHLIDEVRRRWTSLPDVIAYLNEVQADAVDHAEDLEGGTEAASSGPGVTVMADLPPQRRYRVNVLVSHADSTGAPVVYEDHPTHENLLGRVEHVAVFGALVTDFNLIKPGALHRANGGYLILDARQALSLPFVWDELKRVLRAREIRIGSVGQLLGLTSTVSLEPQPIPVDLKVVLIGDRLIYYLLSALDPEFGNLFKVPADFGDDIDWSDENALLYARMVATIARRQKLRVLDRGAVGRVVEHAARLAGDAAKLSIHQQSLYDLLREADYWAAAAKSPILRASHVDSAIEARIHRADRVREEVYEQIRRGTLLIDLGGEKVGQVNGLVATELGGFSFARPCRITARARLGRGQLVDIEREVELSGPIHSKGVLILQGFLTARYAADQPLSLSASLVFEQSYSAVEGDSASSAELYALLSALADVPVRQSIAVTGSVNQYGHVQAIGAVNEKIEGFFDVCRQMGLSGRQGVIIPRANVQHLMLRRDVVEAVADQRFHVWPVETIDQGMEILTGLAAGERDADGQFLERSINQRVEARLVQMAEAARAFGVPARPEERRL